LGKEINWRLFINLTPFIPLSFQERGRNKKEGGFAPFLKLLSPFP